MDLHYFINKYESKPEDMWCCFHREQDGKHCTHGFCNSEEELALFAIAEKYYHITGGGFASITNGGNKNYQQPHPKQRVLAAFYDMQKEENERMEIADEIIYNVHESLVLLD